MSDPSFPLQAYDLTCERQKDPLGIDDRVPVLAWKLANSGRMQDQLGGNQDASAGNPEQSGRNRRQSAYCIRVVKDADARDADPRDEEVIPVWDSGLVRSDQCVDVPYGGNALESGARYLWVVRVLDEADRDSGWSEPASFETAFLSEPLAGAAWIGAPGPTTRHLDLDTAAPYDPHRNVERIWLPRGADGSVAEGEPNGTDDARRTVRFRPPPVTSNAAITRIRLLADAGTAAEIRASVDDSPIPVDGSPAGVAVNADSSIVIDVTPGSPEAQPGLAARLDVSFASGETTAIVSDGSWEVATSNGDSFAESLGLHGLTDQGRSPLTHRPSSYLRKGFELSKPISRARLYATALGFYEARINGRQVGADSFAPGWTDYPQRLQYQTYDVTDLLSEGENVLGATLADGWYAGNLCWMGPFVYGVRRAFRALLRIDYEDGTQTTVVTDDSWRVGEGEIRFADLQNGEVIDHRRTADGWDSPGFAIAKMSDSDDETWVPAELVNASHGPLEAQASPAIAAQHVLPAKSVERRGPGRFMVDFGQNLVGWVRLRASGSEGQRILLRHAEVLDHKGDLYLEALRSARAADEFILRGGTDNDASSAGGEVFEPKFTVHGFRYCEVSGYPGDLRSEDIEAVVSYAKMKQTGTFECSDETLNQLQRNIVWGQRGNFLAVPTDCPQRDERLGWTGDIQVFASTAAFNYDVRGFLRKWLRDLRDAQNDDGGVPHVAPDVIKKREGRPAAGAAGWGDAIVIVPWALLEAYGDERAVAESYEAITSWLDYLEHNSEGYIRPDEGFADWLAPTPTPKDLVSTAFFAYAAKLAARLAHTLGQDGSRWLKLYGRVRTAFRNRWVRGGGEVVSGTQTAYVLALKFGLLTKDEEPRAAERLVNEIAARRWHLATGFLGTPYLLEVLERFGHEDAAFRLLKQESCPSWLYPIVHGDATTIWERWDSWSDARGFQDPNMTSFNHYAYGCVGEWMYRVIGGISPATPGYKHFVVRPKSGGGITWAKTTLETPYGEISVNWRKPDDRVFALDVMVPPNTTADVWLPGATMPTRIGSGIYTFGS